MRSDGKYQTGETPEVGDRVRNTHTDPLCDALRLASGRTPRKDHKGTVVSVDQGCKDDTPGVSVQYDEPDPIEPDYKWREFVGFLSKVTEEATDIPVANNADSEAIN